MIIDTEKWQEIFKTLGQHKLRTGLTAFGVFWGIFMLTVLLGAGKGLENGVIEGFPRVANSVYIWVQGTTQVPHQGLPIGRQIRLDPTDVKAIEENVPSVSFIRGQNSVGIWDGTPPYTKYKDKNGTFYVQGTHAGMANINSMRITEGRGINEIDDDERRKVAVIGTRVKTQLFDEGINPIGENITLSGISFTVIGVFKSLADGNQQQEEEKIYIPAAKKYLVVTGGQQEVELAGIVFKQDKTQVEVLQEETLTVITHLRNNVERNIVVIDYRIRANAHTHRHGDLPFADLHAAFRAAVAVSGRCRHHVAAEE